ncbi:MAG: hypothetical protein CL840_11690 [Crocinitomicaceae bacterium]|nr:hypothetical protein [Crocinitomicaceae bacterium]|tara:strand:+ start:9513 stop:9896 length:384 start_codon:yes stop_codon:yes gene_type:complete
MQTSQIQQPLNPYSASRSGLKPNRYEKTSNQIRKLEMKDKNSHLEIKVHIDGLWGGNYKIEATGKYLTITALRYVFNVDSENKKSKGKFRWITSSLFLPYQVEEGTVDSRLEDGYLLIHIPRKLSLE